MTYRWLTEIPDILSGHGIPFVFVPGWETRGRPPSIGPNNPSGVLNHHTASPVAASDAAELGVILNGNSEAPGPIYHLWTSRSLVTHVVAAGRCNHGGRGVIEHLGTGATDANANLIAHSASNDGVGEYWRDDLVGRMIAVNAALCAGYGWPAEHSYFHWYTGIPAGNYKIDPAGPWFANAFANKSRSWDMGTWRRLIAEKMRPAVTQPRPLDISEDKMQVRWRHSDYANVFVMPDGTPESSSIDAAFSNMPMTSDAHAPTLASCCYRSWGITGVNAGDVIAKAEAGGFLVRLGPH